MITIRDPVIDRLSRAIALAIDHTLKDVADRNAYLAVVLVCDENNNLSVTASQNIDIGPFLRQVAGVTEAEAAAAKDKPAGHA